MRKITNFETVLENAELKESCGVEELIYVNSTIDLNEVIYYRESINDKKEIEPFTLVTLRSGNIVCLNVEFNKFDQILKKQLL